MLDLRDCVLKKIPNLLDCNLKKDYQILIVFSENIPDTTGKQMTVQKCSCSHLTQRLFLHYLGKLEQAEYYISIQGSIII